MPHGVRLPITKSVVGYKNKLFFVLFLESLVVQCTMPYANKGKQTVIMIRENRYQFVLL